MRISNAVKNNLFTKGFEFYSTSDKINILSNNLELNNFLQANKKSRSSRGGFFIAI